MTPPSSADDPPSQNPSPLPPIPALAPAPADPPSSSSTFPFPPEYHFPPFFTRQTNRTTRHAQLTKWAALVLAYCQHYRIFKLSLAANNSPHHHPQQPVATAAATAPSTASFLAPPDTTAQFYNKAIDRRLSAADIREVLDFLRRDGRAEPVNSSSSLPFSGLGGAGNSSGSAGSDSVWWIYWRTPDEWAAMIESWINMTAQKGSVLTLYELVAGEATRGQPFYGLDDALLRRSLGVLVKRGKAQIFGQEGSEGVKFF